MFLFAYAKIYIAQQFALSLKPRDKATTLVDKTEFFFAEWVWKKELSCQPSEMPLSQTTNVANQQLAFGFLVIWLQPTVGFISKTTALHVHHAFL